MRIWLLPILSFLICTCNTTPPDIIIDGILEVPENRNKTDSRTLKLAYKVLKAKDTNSHKAPIVFLQGGPGAATLILEESWKNHTYRNDRDIILMDQRGTGASEAFCTEIGDALFAIMRQNLSIEEDIKATNNLLAECKATIKNDEVDLAGYNSRENAADFEDLRKALGYKKWNLFGGSYGSRLGLTIMRDFPNSVRSAVLSAILPPETNYFNNSIQNFENSLFAVLLRCKEDGSCNSRYPNLKERLMKVLRKLQSDPLQFEFEGKPFVLNTHDAFLLLFVSLYNRSSIANIPLLIEAIENSEIEPLRNALKGFEYMFNLINWPMNYSVMVYEELPFNDLATMDQALKSSEIGFAYPQNSSTIKLLKNWHSFRATDLENQPVVSEIPILLTSGGLDHVTPISNAKGAIKHLKNGYELLFLDEAHNSLYNACFYQIAEDFLNDPLHKPDMECSEKRKPIEWNLSTPLQ